jgi:hypothetical protein
MVGACIVAQLALGPAAAMVRTTADWLGGRSHRHSRQAMIANIPPNASVVAPLGYVSHLAMREQLYSLHHILKGLKTLSRSAYEPPPPTDYVLLDYEDSATFDASSGYFHPVMRTVDGRIIPSSEQLLHDFLKQAQWLATSKNEVTLLRRSTPRPPPAAPNTPAIFSIATHTQLLSISKSADVLRPGEPIDIRLIWNFAANHDAFPWMLLALTKNPTGERILITKGLCAPECDAGIYAETWRITSHDQLTAGEYSAEALFVDNSNKAWAEATDQRRSDLPLLAPPVPLGTIRISDGSGLTAP